MIHGDCMEILKSIPENSIDAIITDPPYGLAFMGKKWDYDIPAIEIWIECLRTLKPGGYLLSFAGTRTQHRMACNIEDSGFEIRDMIAWVYGSGFPKSLNIGKAVDKLQGNEREVVGIKQGTYADIKRDKETGQDGLHGGIAKERPRVKVEETKGTSEWEGWGTALKPALEPITMARKPLSEKTIAENCLKWGTGGLNIDECRVGVEERDLLEKRPILNISGIYGQGLAGSKAIGKTTQGRFPANFIHDGSDEVLNIFPETKSIKSNRGNINIGKMAGGSGQSEKTDTIRGHNDSGSAAKFFYCAKAGKDERNRGCDELEERQYSHDGRKKEIENPFQRQKSVARNNHPTVKPISLIQYLIKLVSREGQTILDPFGGSGTTAIACLEIGRNYVLIEKESEYVEIANKRIESWTAQGRLF